VLQLKNIMKNILLYIVVLFSINGFSQRDLSKLLKKFNKETIPYITTDELISQPNRPILLDSREFNEYEVSHLKGAIYVGYDNFEIDSVAQKLPNKDKKIVVYCSLGIRSETVALKLKKAGYTNVLNLYGGIFEWKNNENSVYDANENETEKVHAFNKDWSKWLLKGIKVYD